MIYLDNAATSRFKPNTALDALKYDILHSANSGRSGHKDAIDADLRIERCRQYLKKMLGASDGYNIIFTKNCTEALNLAILGGIKSGDRVVTSQNEHNSVLRPLFHLQQQEKIELTVLQQNDQGNISLDDIKDVAKNSDVFVFGSACNVTDALLDVEKICKIAREYNIMTIIDGAQSVPLIDLDMQKFGVSMLACPAHKGLHGVQGVGFLIVKEDISLSPLIYGGTGTHSQELVNFTQMPESYEAGTLFSGGISALYHSAKWSWENRDKNKNNIVRLSKTLAYNLKNLRATIYSNQFDCGIVSFNVGNIDSAYIADKLNDFEICVRSGLHCAPLVHKHLNTLSQGAVRASLGVDTTDIDILRFSIALEKILAKYPNSV